jgi:hypothetical protein
MALTPTDRRKVKELEEIAGIARVDFWNFADYEDRDQRKACYDLARDRMVRVVIVSHYVFFDELLTNLIGRHYFGAKRSEMKLWKTKRFRNFQYYIMEELSLMKKVALVKAFKPIPSRIAETVRLTNVLRNAVAHSFFPANKRDFRRTKKVTYKGQDVYTVEGLRLFNDEAYEAIDYLFACVYGSKIAKLAFDMQESE